MTDGCYSEGDSQGLPGFIHPRVLGIPTISFQLKLYSHTSTRCNTLQHTATHCNTLQKHCNTRNSSSHAATNVIKTHINTLQHAATRCNTLQQQCKNTATRATPPVMQQRVLSMSHVTHAEVCVCVCVMSHVTHTEVPVCV